MLALYPPFLATALKTPLTRPFADKRTRLGLAIASTSLFFAVLLTPLKFGATLLYLLLVLLFVFALIASVHVWAKASGTERTRAGIFALAFGIRDICWSVAYGSALGAIWFGNYLVVDPDAQGAVYIFYALGTLIAIPLIAYGILRTQLFDIDLRIRWTIKQSTLAAAMVSIMFTISEGLDRFLSAELGSVPGLLAAALVLFFLAPLQRFAERVASAAMPNTQNTPEYAAYRKLQVYEAALSEALQEGGISPKERALLNRLRDTLDISPADASSLEDGLLESPSTAK
jgi:hypothetical protein